MTNSQLAARRARSVGLLLVGLALVFPVMGTAQDPPQSNQDPPPKTGQEKGGTDKGGQEKGPQDKKGGQDAPAKDDQGGKKKSKADEALEKIKKESGDVPAVNVKKENMEAAGVARKKAEDIRNVQRVPVAQPRREEITAVTTGKGSPAQVRRWARYQLSLFTDPDQDRFVQKNHDDVLRLIKQSDPDYAALLKRELLEGCEYFVNEVPDEPKISTAAKVNMLSLVDELHNLPPDQDSGKPLNGVELLLDTLRKQDRHGDGVLYVAMNALARAKELKLTTVETERQAARLLMQIARRGELQPLLLETLCRTLGTIGMPFEGLVNEAVEVATFLANIATNENLPERTRIEAAIALGNLRKEGVMNYAYEVEAWVFAKAYLSYLNWVIANRAAEPAKVGPNVIRYLGVRLYDAMRKSMSQASGAPGQDRLRTLLTAVEPSLRDILDKEKDQPPDPEAVVEWLKTNNVAPLKLARRAQEIRPVAKPAAAGQPPMGPAADR